MKFKHAFLSMLILLSFVCYSHAQHKTIVGDWIGTLSVQGTNLRLGFTIQDKNGTLESTMDSYDQGALGIPTDKTTFKDNKLEIEVSLLQGKFSGTYNPGTKTIGGTWSQGGMTMDLQLLVLKDRDALFIPKNSTKMETNKANILGTWSKLNLKLKFYEDGKYEVYAQGKVFNSGKYELKNGVFHIEDVEGQDPCAPGVIGKYKVSVYDLNDSKDKKAVFLIVDDPCPGRKGLQGQWTQFVF